MSRYRVARDYRAVYKSRPIGFDKGAVVDVDDDTAVWVNHDSPDCLVPADEAPADEAPADEAPADEAPADEAPPSRRSRKR